MKMMQSETIAKLAEALSKAQSKFTGAVADSDNPFFKSKYADLESVWQAVKGPLTENGLCIVQLPVVSDKENEIGMVTQLMHTSGEWIQGEFSIPIVKRDPQAVGSAITYCRRYTLQAILCIPSVDDDAEGAMERGKNNSSPNNDKNAQIINEVAKAEIAAATSVGQAKTVGRKYWPSATSRDLQSALTTMVNRRCAEIEEAMETAARCNDETA